MKAIVLAAGYGKRLSPVTEIIPKPMLPIKGFSIIETIIDSLINVSISEVVIITGHLSNKLKDYVDHINDNRVQLTYIDQAEPMGTGHAVMLAKDFIDDTVVVLAADTAFNKKHIKGIIDFHVNRNADASLCLKRLKPEVIGRASSVKLSDNNEILDFIEKPEPGTEFGDISAALLHVYEPVIVEYVDKLSLSTRGEYELTEAINMMINDGKSVCGELFSKPSDLTDICDILGLNFPYLKPYI